MKRGFTLIELLICIGIMALLIGILIPVISNSRKNAYKTTCASNLRSVGQAVRIYVDDNDGTWPPEELWTQWNNKAAVKLANCPLTIVPPDKKAEMDGRGRVTGYAYNQDLFAWNDKLIFVDGVPTSSNPGTSDKDILYPSCTVAFFDAAYNTVFAYGPDPNSGFIPYPYDAQRGWERHNGGANYLFCDGHVQWLKASQVRPGIPHINDGTVPSFSLQSKND